MKLWNRPSPGTSDRGRALKHAVGSSLASKGIGLTCSLISVPMVLGYLGKDQYGVWATITSFLAVLVFSDLGLGNGLLNKVSAANGRGDFQSVQRSSASAFVAVAGLGAVLAIASSLAWIAIDWRKALSLSETTPVQPAAHAVLMLVLVFSLNMPISIIQKIEYGMQRGKWVSFSQACAALLGLAIIYLAVIFDLGLPVLVPALVAASLICDIVVGYFFLKKNPLISPSLADCNKGDVKALFRVGVGFVFLQIAVALCYASDNLIVAHIFGTEAVAEYSIHQKLYSPITILAGLALVPLWSAFGDANAKGDMRWIKNALTKSTIILVSLGVVGGGALFFFCGFIINHWLSGQLSANSELSLAFTVWIVIDLAGRGVAMFLNGVGIIKQQVIIVCAFVPLCLLLKILMAQWLGLSGVVWGTALAWLMVHLPAYGFLLSRYFRINNNIKI